MIKKYIMIILLSIGMLSVSFAFTLGSYRFNNDGCLVGEVASFNDYFQPKLVVEDNQWLISKEPCEEKVTSIENENLLKNTIMPSAKYTVCEKEPGTENIVCKGKNLVDYKKDEKKVTVYNFRSKLRDPIGPCCD